MIWQQILRDLPTLFSIGNLQFLGRAAMMTIALTAVGCCSGFVIGFLIAVLRSTQARWLLAPKLAAIGFVEVFRRIPFLVTLFIVLFASQAISPDIPLFLIAVVSICILSSAYLSEIVRAGLESVPRQQVEAAEAMNLGHARTLLWVVVPQAWKVILPPAVAFAVMFVKDTALVSQAGVVELMFAGKALSNRGLNPVLVYSTILAIYIAISYPIALFGSWLEQRLSQRLAAPRAPLETGVA